MKNIKAKYHPILFSTPMVQAILEGRKTQTRRIVKDEMLQKSTKEDDLEFLLLTVSQKYKEGDILWIRESFYKTTASELKGGFYYKASIDYSWNFKYKPSIHMPKEACRIFLKLKLIRVERLNDITEEDAVKEGVKLMENGGYRNYHHSEILQNYLFTKKAKVSFFTLWESINGRESISLNPFVWVYEFEQIEKPLDFMS